MKRAGKNLFAAVLIACLLSAAFLLQNGRGRRTAATPETSAPVCSNAADTGDPETGPGTSPPVAEASAQAAAVPLFEAESEPLGQAAEQAASNKPGATQEPEAVEPSETAVPPEIESAARTCTLTINCSTILDNMDRLAKGKESLVASDGRLFCRTDVEFEEGDTVFHVLQRELQNQNMHMEFSTSPLYGSVYIEGICNLYELDCGELSGWEYSVNGVFPSYSCSEYVVSDGDEIAWVYTCDLGNDIGDGY